MSRTAVVILNYNGENYLRQFLPSVVQHSEDADIIVADNGSTDQSIRVLEEEFPQVQIIRLNDNYGYCGGYNRALAQVKADYYVLLNSDIEVTPGWLKPMVTLLDKNPGIGAVQPKILSFHKKNLFEYAGAAGGFMDALGYPFCRGRIFDHVEEDVGQYNDEIPIFWATGACLLIRSSVYHEFNGLDEDFFAHMEEIDLCWKMHRANYQVYYCGYSTIYHVGAGTLGYDNPRKTYLNFRNGLALLIKHMYSRELLWKLPLRLMLDGVAAGMFLLKRQPANFQAVLKAHHYIMFRTFGQVLQKRKQLQLVYPNYDRKAIYRGSILFRYFIRRKKTYPRYP